MEKIIPQLEGQLQVVEILLLSMHGVLNGKKNK